MDAPLSEEIKDDEAKTYQEILDANLIDQNECFTIVPTPMQEQEQSKVELKVFPQNLRYEFIESNWPVIVNDDSRKNEIE